MPPGPVFNWLCVASSACDILVRVARLRASQVASDVPLVNTIKCTAKNEFKTSPGASATLDRRGVDTWRPGSTENQASTPSEPLGASAKLKAEFPLQDVDGASRGAAMTLERRGADTWRAGSTGNQVGYLNEPLDVSASTAEFLLQDVDQSSKTPSGPSAAVYRHAADELHRTTSSMNTPTSLAQESFVADVPVENTQKSLDITQGPSSQDHTSTEDTPSAYEPHTHLVQSEVPVAADNFPVDSDESHRSADVSEAPTATRQLQSSKVPSSRIGRLFHYGGLAASLGYGAASEMLRRTSNSEAQGSEQSVMMTEANITRLVSKLSQMRGAALKLGQFLSIQDTHTLPADVDKIFRRVQDSAHYMPDWQMEKVLASSLGPDWAHAFTSFHRVPFAAASIGQVHTATLAPHASPTGAPAHVAVKIQFPNIANSIASDLGYIRLLLSAGRLLPKGLFLDRTMQVMKDELADECDYAREAVSLRRFGAPECLGGDVRFKVPWVWDGSTDRVLVMEHVGGTSVGDADVARLSQADRDDIAARIIELCLKELFEFRLMQTDPNWSNFLWNAHTRRVELVDFGATRAYSREFIDRWLRLLQAAAADDREACVAWSLELGYLTGGEDQLMVDAHVDSMTLLATPFKAQTRQPFAFGQGTPWADITAQIRAQIPVMLRHRLTPPPRETYSLNRKLSGAFLLASRLGATVDTKAIWDKVVGKYEFAP